MVLVGETIKKIVVWLVVLSMVVPMAWMHDMETGAEETRTSTVSLDRDYIWNKTEALSDIIFNYPPGMIEKGRAFGSWGEGEAADDIENWMNQIGLQNVDKERIGDTWNSHHLWKKREPNHYYLEVWANDTDENIHKNMTCFPLLSNDNNADYDFWREVEFHPVGSNFEGENKTEKPIWLINVSSEWGHQYDWGSYVATNRWNMDGYILMNFHNDTLFMGQLWPWTYMRTIPGLSVDGDNGNWIKNKLANGYTVEAHIVEKHQRETVESYNVIGEIPASSNGNDNKTVVIGAHYDSWWCQGAVDNAVGPAIMLGIAKYFNESNIQPKYRLRFVAFGGEEWPPKGEVSGLLLPYCRGSRYYCRYNHSDESEMTPYMINIDMVACNASSSILRLHSNDGGIATTLYDIANFFEYDTRTGYSFESVGEPKDSDDAIFDEYFTTTTVSFGKEPYYWYHQDDGSSHQIGDVTANVDRNDLNVTAQIALATVLNLTMSDSSPPVSCIDSLTPYWYNASQYVTVTASGTDNVSGVCKMRLEYRHRADNTTPWGDWTTYGTGGSPVYHAPWTWEFQVWSDGIYQLRTIATDYLGNEETKNISTHDVEIGKDTEEPDTTHALAGTSGNNGWYTSLVTVTLTRTDDLSGVDITKYKIGYSWIDYTSSFNVSNNGYHTIQYYSVDKAGNEETPPNSVSFKIDKTDPNTSCVLSGNTSDGYWFRSNVAVELNATDYPSRVHETRYSLDGNPWTTYTSSFVVSDEGAHTVEYYSIDNAGNQEDIHTKTFEIDITPPGPPVISSSTHPNETEWYNNSDPLFNWTEPADASGIQGYSYALDHSPSTTPDKMINTSGNTTSYSGLGDGTWYFHVRAEDNAGNWGSTDHYQTRIDTTTPSITNVTAKPLLQQPGDYVNITCDVTDDASGVEWVYLLVEDPEFWCLEMSRIPGTDTYYCNHTYSTTGTYDYMTISGDYAGNSVSSQHNFYILNETTNHAFDLCKGWNSITIPLENDYTASSLGENISGCSIVAYRNASSQSFHSFVVGTSPPSSDFAIKDGVSYYVYLTDPTTFLVNGSLISSVAVELYPGFNDIGWFQPSATNASTLGNSILNCSIVARWNASSQSFNCFLVGVSPPSYAFAITRGMGIIVYVTESSTWNGTARGGYNNSGTGEEGSMSMPHPVYGYAYYQSKQGITPATGAAVAIENNRTGEQLKTIVEDGGIYQFELSDMDWRDNDEIVVTIYGTGDYQGFTGSGSVVADDSRAYQQMEDIYLTK